MHTLKLVCLTIIHGVQQVWSVLKAIPVTIQQRSRQSARNGLEAERLDRLRNPSKYLGK